MRTKAQDIRLSSCLGWLDVAARASASGAVARRAIALKLASHAAAAYLEAANLAEEGTR